MPNIEPISALCNYSDIQDYEKAQATLCLMNELAKGRRSSETKGWLSSEEMREHFRVKADEV